MTEIEQKEKTLPIEENGQYKNISLKQKWDEGTLVRDGLADGEYIIVEKTNFVEGRAVNTQYGTSYSCGVKYNNEDVNFWLDEKEHTKYAETGGLGDKVKILNLKETFIYNKIEKKKNVLHFSVVQ